MYLVSVNILHIATQQNKKALFEVDDLNQFLLNYIKNELLMVVNVDCSDEDFVAANNYDIYCFNTPNIIIENLTHFNNEFLLEYIEFLYKIGNQYAVGVAYSTALESIVKIDSVLFNLHDKSNTRYNAAFLLSPDVIFSQSFWYDVYHFGE